VIQVDLVLQEQLNLVVQVVVQQESKDCLQKEQLWQVGQAEKNQELLVVGKVVSKFVPLWHSQ
jgi:hypothetical protein